MRPFPLLVLEREFRIELRSMLAGLFPLAARRNDVRELPDHLKRDIGLDGIRAPDRDRLLR